MLAEPLRSVERLGPTDLIGIVVDADDVGTREAGDVPHRAANSAAHVHDGFAGLQGEAQREIMLISPQRFAKGFVDQARREMERLIPAILVKICHKVVVLVGDFHVGLPAGIQAQVADIVREGIVVMNVIVQRVETEDLPAEFGQGRPSGTQWFHDAAKTSGLKWKLGSSRRFSARTWA